MRLVISLLLLACFFANFLGRTFALDLSLAPGLSVKNAILYLIVGVLLFEVAVSRRLQVDPASVIVPFALYTAYAILTWILIVLVLQYPDYSPRSTLISLKAGPVEHLLVFLVYFYGVPDAKSAKGLLRAIIWLVIIGNIITVIDVLNIPDLGLIQERDDGRAGGPIGASNAYGSFLALFLPAIAALFWTSRGLTRALAGIGAALSGLAFLMALSRGAIVGLLLGAVVGAYYLRALIPAQTIIRAAFATVLLSAVMLAAFLFLGYGDLLLERFGLFGMNRFDASSGRTAIWAAALMRMMESPVTFLTGFGWNAYESQTYVATHNQYLNILFNLGAIGLVLFLLVAANVLRAMRRAIPATNAETRPFVVACVFGFLGFLGSLVFGEAAVVWLYAWAFVGLSLRIAVSQQRESLGGTARSARAGALDGGRLRAYP